MPDLAEALRKFSPATLKIIEEAAGLARTQGHGFLGVEHLLKALLQTPLAQRLQPEARQALDQILTPLLEARYDAAPPGNQIHVTRRVHALLTGHAITVADQRGHTRVEPEDLMIAIVREGHSLPVLRLREQVQGAVEALLNVLEQVAHPPLEIPYELRSWCDDLTARVEQLPPFIEGGREQEIIDQVVRVLVSADWRVSPTSPVLIGEAGVGKTAIVQLLARKIMEGGISDLPRGVRIVQVNMNGMVAGTILRGMFEQRLEQTIRFAQQHRDRVILFIDELHMIVGAGQALGVVADTAQILLDPLGRGEIRLIGATTIEQYRQYIEQDPALARRFRAIPVREPSLDETRHMLNQLCPTLEKQSGVQISPEAREKALELSRFYLRSRHLPDKPISWLKEAIGLVVHQKRNAVGADDVVTIVSEQTGIPSDIIFRNAQGRLGRMEQVLRERVMGQDHVITQIAPRIRLNLSPLRENLNRPIGVFLFLGPSGVGKTELAKALAEFLLGDEGQTIRLDMSEYASEVTTHQLIGPPPGILGCDRGGRLTNAVRARPYTIVLLDEFEKAHPVIRNLFLQVFDEGWLTDGMGRKVYFSDAILLATSNLASEKYRRLQSRPGFRSMGTEDLDFQRVRAEVERSLVEEGLLPPELRNRFDLICVFDPLSHEVLCEIAKKLLDDLVQELQRWGKTLLYDNEVIEFLAQEGYDPLLGARKLKRLFVQSVREKIAEVFDQGSVFRVEVASFEFLQETLSPKRKLVVNVQRLEAGGEPCASPSGNP